MQLCVEEVAHIRQAKNKILAGAINVFWILIPSVLVDHFCLLFGNQCSVIVRLKNTILSLSSLRNIGEKVPLILSYTHAGPIDVCAALHRLRTTTQYFLSFCSK